MICLEPRMIMSRVAVPAGGDESTRPTRWFGIVLVVLLLLGSGGWTISGAHAATFLERAQEYLDDGDLHAASVELKNALQREPNNAEARFLLGKVHLRLGDSSSATKELLRARELGYESEELDLILAYARLGQSQYDAVLSSINDKIAIESDIQRDLYVARGEALLGLGRFDEAQAIFDRVLQAGPHVRAIVNKARIAIALGNSQEARTLLDRAAEISTRDPYLVSVDASWHFYERNFEKAAEQFELAIQVDPTKLENHLGRIQSLLALGELEEAATLIEGLKESNPDLVAIILQDAIVQFLRANYEAAEVAAEQVLAVAKSQPQALLVAGQSAYHLTKYEKARRHLGAYLAQNPQDHQARLVLGMTMLQLGYPEQAIGTLTAPEGGEIPDNSDYLSVLTSAAFGMGDRQAALKYLERLAVTKPGDAAVQEQLAAARQSQGDDAGAVQALNRAIALEPDRLSAYARLFSVHLKQEQVNEALSVAEDMRARFPENSLGDTLAGMAYLTKEMPGEALVAFQQALEKDPGNAEAAGNLANILVLRGRLAEAQEVLDHVLEEKPGHLRTLLAAAVLANRTGDAAKAEQMWRQAIETNPEHPQPRVLLGNHYITTNRASDALALTEPALASHPKNRGLLESVGQARLRTGDLTGALEVIKTLASLAPDSYPAQELLMRVLELNGRIPEALTAAERTLALNPGNLPARVGQVRYLAQLGRLEEARTRLEPLQSEFPDRVELLLLEGRIFLQEGHDEEALALYRKAHELDGTNWTLTEWARALFAGERADEAMALMGSWLDQNPDDLTVRRTLAEMMLKSGQIAEAVPHYEAILEMQPNNVRALNNLAWIRMTLGETDEAVALGRKALALVPHSPSVADTLGVILLEAGQNQEALELLRSARQAEADNTGIQFHFAQALAANGEIEGAVAELRALLEQAEAFQERPEAEALLAKLTQ